VTDRRGAAVEGDPASRLLSSVTSLPGITPLRGRELAEEGIRTVFDLLLHLPRRYEDRSAFRSIGSLRIGEAATVTGTILGGRSRPPWYGRVAVHEIVVDDGTGSVTAVWYGQRFLAKSLVAGRRVALFGKLAVGFKNRTRLEGPEWEILSDDAGEDGGIHVGRVVPIYSKIGSGSYLSGKRLRRLLWNAVHSLPPELDDLLGDAFLVSRGWPSRAASLAEAHFPGLTGVVIPEGSEPGALTFPPRERLAFEELLALQLELSRERRRRRAEPRGIVLRTTASIRDRAREVLPFPLTGAQKRVLKEIASDLASGKEMARLLQGDVGSGKTIVALIALLLAAENGAQGAFLAPTEILAEQHAALFSRRLGPAGIRWALLTGSVKGAERRRILEELSAGRIQILIGTHAILQQPIAFRNLALAVIDEQHRFGVAHLEALGRKGSASAPPHVLVMTATPIPRSLALTLYGDLDISILDELPPGRQPVRTHVREESARADVLGFVASRVAKGERAFVVFPFVEGSASQTEVRALLTHFAEAQKLLPGVATVLVHGRMKSADRLAAMDRFARGDAPVLFATTVIEVGVDVPEAAVMVIENPERFGLAQLHQLRGRIGRGKVRSHCILLVGAGASEEARRRLEEFASLTDGFRVAEADLLARGPGEILGRRQSGRSDFRVADPIAELPLMVLARAEAEKLVESEEDDRLLRFLGEWRSGGSAVPITG